MIDFPFNLTFGFIAATLLALLLGWWALRSLKWWPFAAIAYLAIHAILASSGFYLDNSSFPPRMLLTFGPALLLLAVLFLRPTSRAALAGFKQKDLVLIHTVRIPVELVLYGLFLNGAIPELMTFSGRNFDILAGLSAPFIYYFGYVRQTLPAGWIRAWNWLCLALLINIIIHGLLSAPLPFQQLAFEQPNVALLYFPFVWLPAFVVPLVLFVHFHALFIQEATDETGLE